MGVDELAAQARTLAVKITAEGKSPHIGSSLSVVDILSSIYFDVFSQELEPSNFRSTGAPRIILSKGHAAAALYAVLHLKGYMTRETLFSYHKNGGLPAHVDTTTKGVEFSTGSLGHGLAVGAGMALANRLNGTGALSIVIMGDGECQEGEVWEAANFAVSKKITNLIAIVDWNGLQAYDHTEDVGGRLEKKWSGFGWTVINADGHDLASLRNAIRQAREAGGPAVILAKTVKCKGIACMEGKIESHYRPPKGDELG